MIHLLERNHTDRFRSLMDQHLPQWPVYRDQLNYLPLAHEDGVTDPDGAVLPPLRHSQHSGGHIERKKTR